MNARFSIAATMAIIGAASVPCAGGTEVVEFKDLHPFTHVATIPASATLSSIRIESVKPVKVATKLKAVTDVTYCAEDRFRGQSMFCPSFNTTESPAAAYEVTYSYTGPPMPSDEYGSTRYWFSVYFRPDEITPGLQQELASGKVKRSTLAEFFHFTTSRGSVQQLVIDEANSFFCKGYYFDGNWMHTDPNCRDRVAYKKAWVPSSYVAVKVAPVAQPSQTDVAGNGPGQK